MRTHTQASAVATAMVLATVVFGCGDGRAPSPIAPTLPQTPSTPTPASPAILYPLSGVVFEVTSAGNAPVEGVEVYCEPCGPPDGHSARYTAADGAYSFDGAGGVATGRIELLLAKRGYILPNQPDLSGPSGNSWMGRVSVTVTGVMRYDIQIIQK